jgi:histidinol-phosphate aminotransferase
LKEIRLDRNEMPYRPPKRVLLAAEESLSNLNRYTERTDMENLRTLLAKYADVSKERIITGPGSELLLREIIHTFSAERKVITVNPTFLPTLQAAKQVARKLTKIQITPPEFAIHSEVLEREISEPSLVIIDNPNNPTGTLLLDEERVRQIVEHPEVVLVIDEAYYEFSGVTYAPLVAEYPNLVITRTIDKALSLAGARVGYLIGGTAVLDAVSSFWTFLPQPSLHATLEALKDPGYSRKNIRKITEERKRVGEELREIGVDVYPSSTNFLLIKTTVPDLGKKLEDRGILVLDLSAYWLPSFIRVSIGLPEENDIFLSEMQKMLKPQ